MDDSINVASSEDTIVINLNDTYGATTTYTTDGLTVGSGGSNFTYTVNNNTWNTSGINGIGSINTITITDPIWQLNTIDVTHIEISEVEKMCAEYPALAKVYENFKTVYDLVKQDWKGKKDAKNNS